MFPFVIGVNSHEMIDVMLMYQGYEDDMKVG